MNSNPIESQEQTLPTILKAEIKSLRALNASLANRVTAYSLQDTQLQINNRLADCLTTVLEFLENFEAGLEKLNPKS